MDPDVMPDLLEWARQTRPSISGTSTPKTPGSFIQSYQTGNNLLNTGKNNNSLSGVTQVLPPPNGTGGNTNPVIQTPVEPAPSGWLDLIFQYWAYILVVIIILLLVLIIVYFYWFSTPSGFAENGIHPSKNNSSGVAFVPSITKPIDNPMNNNLGFVPFVPVQSVVSSPTTSTISSNGKSYEMIELADGAPVPPGFVEVTE